MDLRIKNSIVEIVVNVSAYQPEYLSYIYARAMNLARACLDLAAFQTGHGMIVVLETFTAPNGIVQAIVTGAPEVAGLCRAFRLPAISAEEKSDWAAVLSLVISEPAILGSLNDLSQILSTHHQAPTNCGRVLDSLRRAVAPNETPKQGWRTLQSLLNSDQAYMQYVSDYSTNPRHGDRETSIPESITIELMKRTWMLMDRFLAYRKMGSFPLSARDFPLLKG